VKRTRRCIHDVASISPINSSFASFNSSHGSYKSLHPLQIASVAARDGLVGMTFCPGKKQRGSALGFDWNRQLDVDISALQSWQTAVVITLNEAWELEQLGVPTLGGALVAAGIEWHHLPIVDGGVPDAAFERAWQIISPDLHSRLSAGERVVVHCKGGLGRTGTIAAPAADRDGHHAGDRDGAGTEGTARRLENDAQEAYVRCGFGV